MTFLALTPLQIALLALLTSGTIIALYFLKVLYRTIGGGWVGLHHDRQPRDSRSAGGPDCKTPDRKVPPADQSDGAVQGGEVVLQKH